MYTSNDMRRARSLPLLPRRDRAKDAKARPWRAYDGEGEEPKFEPLPALKMPAIDVGRRGGAKRKKKQAGAFLTSIDGDDGASPGHSDPTAVLAALAGGGGTGGGKFGSRPTAAQVAAARVAASGAARLPPPRPTAMRGRPSEAAGQSSRHDSSASQARAQRKASATREPAPPGWRARTRVPNEGRGGPANDGIDTEDGATGRSELLAAQKTALDRAQETREALDARIAQLNRQMADFEAAAGGGGPASPSPSPGGASA